MRTTIDKAGRIVVPKRLRDAMGLTPGRKIDIVFIDGRIQIEAAPVELALVDDDCLPLIRALEDLPAPDAAITRDTLEAIRAERDARHV